MPADLRWPILAALAVLGFVVPAWLGSRASLPPAVYFQHDQRHYLAMARQEAADAPFSWRLLPSALVRVSKLPAERGFHALTLLSLALIPPAFAALLSAAGVSTVTAVMLGVVAALSPPVAGYLSWDFIRPDGVSLLLIGLSAWAVIRARPAIFLVTLVALSLTKETWVIAAAFALFWSRAASPAFWKWAVAATVLALVVSSTVRLAIPANHSYSLLENVRDLYLPFDARTVSRRLLLATAATWTVLTPLAAFALARRLHEPRAWAAGLAVLISSAQVLVAIDTQRIVAAALPFILLACAWELERMTPRARLALGGFLALAQIPWLLSYARIWTPSLRAIEIAIALSAIAAVIYGAATARRRQPITAA